MTIESPGWREKARAILRVVRFRPKLSAGIVLLSLGAAVFEGIGLSFLIPVIELAQGGSGQGSGGAVGAFRRAYEAVGVPFTLEFVIAGVGLMMVARYTSSFLVAWLQEILRATYVRDVRLRSFEKALGAEVRYFDTQGSDEILNTIITESRYTGRLISNAVELVQQSLLTVMYASLALFLAPVLTVASGVVLGVLTLVLRGILEPGFAVGDRVADANERVQNLVQVGMQGIRDVKLFTMVQEVMGDFVDAVDQHTEARISYRRNQVAMDKIYQMMTALTVLSLVYVGLEFTNLTLAALTLFLFVMFRLTPRVSRLNNLVYRVEGDLPHLLRVQQFVDALDDRQEPDDGDERPPDVVESVVFEDVWFSYGPDETVLRDVSFRLERGEFVAFAGPSGAGKSTIVSLLARFYATDRGSILANGTPIEAFRLRDWRSKVAVVRQSPHLFNDTLENNLTVGNRAVSRDEIERACEIAQVTEFLDDLPEGYETMLGDDGVRLSGGQRQRVALARALLKDADVLVLDEATSDLDTGIESTVQQAVESMDEDYAMITIAHRLSTVQNADRIYTVENGEITEVGDHQELISNDGTYAQLYDTQQESA